MPSLLLTNANRLLNKLDDLSLLVQSSKTDVIAITETWLDGCIPDSAIAMQFYSIVRRDRQNQMGGGVLLYVHKDVVYRLLGNVLDGYNADFEITWVLLRPPLLPRRFSNIIIAVVYCPPWYSVSKNNDLSRYIVNCIDKLNHSYSNVAFFICGDFNQLQTGTFNRHLCFKQIVNFPTRGSNILDKIFTNCSDFYSSPISVPPLGKSDHCCIFVSSSGVQTECASSITVKRRRFNDNVIQAIGLDLCNTPWHQMYRLDDSQQQANFFYGVISSVFDKHAPVFTSVRKISDRPWVNDYFRQLVRQRDVAWRHGDTVLYRKLRNRVNRVGSSLKSQFYLDRVDNLKKSNPHEWWQSIKILSGWSGSKGGSPSCFEGITNGGDSIGLDCLPDVFNKFLISITDHILPIDPSVLNSVRMNLDKVMPDRYIVSEYSVYNVLSRVKLNKSVCDEFLSNRMLRQFADVLAGPICAMINTSFRTGFVPQQWKVARITPLPKVLPPADLQSDLRPIAITSSVSKVAEHFICQFFNEHFDPLVDDNQFGCTRSRSTTLALLKFTHLLFTSSDLSCNFIRILLVDFSKAFDLVDSNVLYDKFVSYGFPSHVTAWFLSFLDKREQYVKVGNRESSVCISHAGTPQGTLSGPRDFKLLINDLSFELPFIKYVDDTNCTSVSDDPLDNSLQLAADSLLSWCGDSGMRVNPLKTKEALIYFGKLFSGSYVPRITINGEQIERVNTFKFLGVIFNSELSWSDHVRYMLDKIARRYFIIHQLSRIGLNHKDIVSVYCAVMRSVLEYACVVWHPGLTATESAEIERVQKRVLRIIFPHLRYKDALLMAKLERLDVRRENLMRTTFNGVKSPSHILNHLLTLRVGVRSTRSQYPYELPRHRTVRFTKSFFTYCVKNRY